ncbi:MAG: winged helix-turn-helix domain-containing protein [bacterium]|nr:winged helix-turn-helix domain-containing protein [bacterium]
MLWGKIGETSGQVYQVLQKKKSVTPKELMKDVKAPYDIIQMALGWLAREGKVKFEKAKGTYKLSLK